MARPIKILNGNSTSKELTLEPSDTMIVTRGQKVIWAINGSTEDTNVASFYIEDKKTSEQIFFFFDRPPRYHTRSGGGRVSLSARIGAEYEYSICWKDRKGIEHTYDPKIAVNPSKRFNLINLILFLLAFVLGLFTLGFLRNKKSRR